MATGVAAVSEQQEEKAEKEEEEEKVDGDREVAVNVASRPKALEKASEGSGRRAGSLSPVGPCCGFCGGGADGEPPWELLHPPQGHGESRETGQAQGRDTWQHMEHDSGFTDGPGWLGPLLGPLSERIGVAGVWVHRECAIWSPEVYFCGVGQLRHVRAAARRGRNLRCTRCGMRGATLGCHVDRCPRTYHLPCGRLEGCLFDHDKYLLTCQEHQKKHFPRKRKRPLTLWAQLARFPTMHGGENVRKLVRIIAERRVAAAAAAAKDLEVEERRAEAAGDDEDFRKRQQRRLDRDLARLVPVILGGGGRERGRACGVNRQLRGKECGTSNVVDGWRSVERRNGYARGVKRWRGQGEKLDSRQQGNEMEFEMRWMDEEKQWNLGGKWDVWLKERGPWWGQRRRIHRLMNGSESIANVRKRQRVEEVDYENRNAEGEKRVEHVEEASGKHRGSESKQQACDEGTEAAHVGKEGEGSGKGEQHHDKVISKKGSSSTRPNFPCFESKDCSGWNSVAGLRNVVESLKEMVTLPLLYPEFFEGRNITPPRGVLLYGPPGTGKTLVAKALAQECAKGSRQVAFFARNGADCLGKYVGDAERQLRLLFQVAEENQPSIIFFDEIDGLAPVRTGRHEDQTQASVVSTLLALMDGLYSRGSVVVIGATNRLSAIDPSLRRPGRFDREIHFPLPSTADRAEILKLHTKTWPFPPSQKLIAAIAKATVGFAGADLRALCSAAAMAGLRKMHPLGKSLTGGELARKLQEEKEGERGEGLLKREVNNSGPLSQKNMGKLPLFMQVQVSPSDWAAALKDAPNPCSKRHSAAALKETTVGGLPEYLGPLLADPLAKILLEIHEKSGVILPPPAAQVCLSLLQKMESIGSSDCEMGSEEVEQQLSLMALSALQKAGLVEGSVGDGERVESMAKGYKVGANGVHHSNAQMNVAEGQRKHIESYHKKNIIEENCESASEEEKGFDMGKGILGGSIGRGFRVLLSGGSNCGQMQVGAALLQAMEGVATVKTLNLPSMLLEGGGDGAVGLSHIIEDARRSAPCILFMPRVETWAVCRAEEVAEPSTNADVAIHHSTECEKEESRLFSGTKSARCRPQQLNLNLPAGEGDGVQEIDRKKTVRESNPSILPVGKSLTNDQPASFGQGRNGMRGMLTGDKMSMEMNMHMETDMEDDGEGEEGGQKLQNVREDEEIEVEKGKKSKEIEMVSVEWKIFIQQIRNLPVDRPLYIVATCHVSGRDLPADVLSYFSESQEPISTQFCKVGPPYPKEEPGRKAGLSTLSFLGRRDREGENKQQFFVHSGAIPRLWMELPPLSEEKIVLAKVSSAREISHVIAARFSMWFVKRREERVSADVRGGENSNGFQRNGIMAKQGEKGTHGREECGGKGEEIANSETWDQTKSANQEQKHVEELEKSFLDNGGGSVGEKERGEGREERVQPQISDGHPFKERQDVGNSSFPCSTEQEMFFPDRILYDLKMGSGRFWESQDLNNECSSSSDEGAAPPPRQFIERGSMSVRGRERRLLESEYVAAKDSQLVKTVSNKGSLPYTPFEPQFPSTDIVNEEVKSIATPPSVSIPRTVEERALRGALAWCGLQLITSRHLAGLRRSSSRFKVGPIVRAPPVKGVGFRSPSPAAVEMGDAKKLSAMDCLPKREGRILHFPNNDHVKEKDEAKNRSDSVGDDVIQGNVEGGEREGDDSLNVGKDVAVEGAVGESGCLSEGEREREEKTKSGGNEYEEEVQWARGLAAVGLISVYGGYQSGEMLLTAVRTVCRGVREAVRGREASERLQGEWEGGRVARACLYHPLFAQAAALEDDVACWAKSLRRLEVAAEVSLSLLPPLVKEKRANLNVLSEEADQRRGEPSRIWDGSDEVGQKEKSRKQAEMGGGREAIEGEGSLSPLNPFNSNGEDLRNEIVLALPCKEEDEGEEEGEDDEEEEGETDMAELRQPIGKQKSESTREGERESEAPTVGQTEDEAMLAAAAVIGRMRENNAVKGEGSGLGRRDEGIFRQEGSGVDGKKGEEVNTEVGGSAEGGRLKSVSGEGKKRRKREWWRLRRITRQRQVGEVEEREERELVEREGADECIIDRRPCSDGMKDGDRNGIAMNNGEEEMAVYQQKKSLMNSKSASSLPSHSSEDGSQDSGRDAECEDIEMEPRVGVVSKGISMGRNKGEERSVEEIPSWAGGEEGETKQEKRQKKQKHKHKRVGIWSKSCIENLESAVCRLLEAIISSSKVQSVDDFIECLSEAGGMSLTALRNAQQRVIKRTFKEEAGSKEREGEREREGGESEEAEMDWKDNHVCGRRCICRGEEAAASKSSLDSVECRVCFQSGRECGIRHVGCEVERGTDTTSCALNRISNEEGCPCVVASESWRLKEASGEAIAVEKRGGERRERGGELGEGGVERGERGERGEERRSPYASERMENATTGFHGDKEKVRVCLRLLTEAVDRRTEIVRHGTALRRPCSNEVC